MKLNHINLTVEDVEATGAFFAKHFGLNWRGGSRKMGFVSDDNGMVITLYRRNGEGRLEYPESFHVGFIVESEARVNEINAALREDGYEVPEPAKMHGSWTFYFRSPGGFVVEVLA